MYAQLVNFGKVEEKVRVIILHHKNQRGDVIKYVLLCPKIMDVVVGSRVNITGTVVIIMAKV